MPFSNVWDQTFPPDTQQASLGGSDLRLLRVDTQQRMAAISGLDASKPAFGSDAQPAAWNGILFFATDTGKIYQWNNPSWTDVTSSFEIPFKAARVVTADFTTTSTSLVNLLTLGTLSPSTNYSYDAWLVFSMSVTTATMAVGLSGPAAPTNVNLQYEVSDQTTALQLRLASSGNPGFGAAVAPSPFSVPISNTVLSAHIWGSIENGANSGTLILQVACTSAATLTVKRGSFASLRS